MNRHSSQACDSRPRPLVSIVLPTYNGARYLPQSIASSLGQTYPNVELIVVVDGSSDESAKILAGYTDPRLKVIHHDKNRGLPEALNTGFAQARGEYLTWTSDDNWYAPEAIDEMVDFLEARPGVGLVYADMWLVDENDNIVGQMDALPANHLKTQPWNGVHACILYTRAAYSVVGDYDPQTRLAEDYDYWLRIAEHLEIAPYHRRLYYYRQHSGSLTQTRGHHAAARQALRVRRRRRWMNLRQSLYWSAYLDMDEAFWSWQRGDLRRTRQLACSALLKNPGNARNLGLLSILLKAVFGSRTTGWFLRIGRYVLRVSKPRNLG